MEIISKSESDNWLNILQDNKCFMKSKKERNLKMLGNVFKKVKNLSNLKNINKEKKKKTSIIIG